MLNVYYGDMPDAVYNTASYFKYDYEDSWITDPFVKDMILDVDNPQYWTAASSTVRCLVKYRLLVCLAGSKHWFR